MPPHVLRRAVSLAAVCVLAVTQAPRLASQQAHQPPPQQQKPPVVRGESVLVTVDVYPQRDGRIVEGLTAADFELFEDDRPQAIEGVEFVRIEPALTDAEPLEDRAEAPAAAPASAPAAGPPIVDAPLLFRATPAATSPLRPVADLQYRRTERLHVEWAIAGPPDQRTARLLSRAGQPLPVPVRLSERELDGRQMLAADVNLAPLAAGDYVLELVAARAGGEVRSLVGFRVLQ